jgi:hypothetical protein
MIDTLLFATLLMSAPDAAAPVSGAGAAAASEPAKEKKICRLEDSSTSRMRKRVCRTAKEIEDARESGKEGVADVRRMNAN